DAPGGMAGRDERRLPLLSHLPAPVGCSTAAPVPREGTRRPPRPAHCPLRCCGKGEKRGERPGWSVRSTFTKGPVRGSYAPRGLRTMNASGLQPLTAAYLRSNITLLIRL